MRIAQAEGKNWKDEVRKYLVAYRSTPPSGIAFWEKNANKTAGLEGGSASKPLMSRNAHNNKIGKITKYRRQFDDFYNFGKYGDCGEFLSNHQMYVNQFHTWCPAMLANMAILANSCQITKFM